MKKGTVVWCNYNSGNQMSSYRKMRQLKIVKGPHQSKRHKQGEIIYARDLSDSKNLKVIKSFYVDKMKIIKSRTKTSEGLPPRRTSLSSNQSQYRPWWKSLSS